MGVASTKKRKRMNRILLVILGLALLLDGTCAIKKKYMDSDGDGINDDDDSDDDNDGVDDDEDEDDDGDGIDDEDEDWDGDGLTNDDDDDGDGIADIHDNDDDGDGLNDDDGEATSPKKAAKAQSGSGPWSTIVFGYFFGLTHYILKTA